jgi:penicillin-binding protein 1B
LRFSFAPGFWTSRFGIAILTLSLAIFVILSGIFAYYYVHFGHEIDRRLSGQVFQNTSRVYASPQRIFTGESLRPGELAERMLRSGYGEREVAGAAGWFHATGSRVEIHPSSISYFAGGNALRVEFGANSITHIGSLADGKDVESAEIEPEVLTNLFDSSREKRRVMRFDDLPPVLVHAVLSAEDKRFFEHPGFDVIRVFGAILANLKRGGVAQGGSTLDMQVARSFFFTTRREWRRKLAETMVAVELERRFTKKQIFELYANEVYLGNRGSFAIRGFGEAAQAYFGKDARELTLGEAAFLAGIIRSPNRYASVERHPERALDARDRVLTQMVENEYVTAAAAAAARQVNLHFVGGTETSLAPYFVDMVKDHLLENITEADLSTQSYRIYTTLDSDLQHAATSAVVVAIKAVDGLLARKYERWRKKGEAVPAVQVALIALDPRTGEIRALVGGRNYGESQLNHAQARRQPGSSFKPFVYAAAFDSAVDATQPLVTPLTTVVDEPTTFEFDGKEYTPNNYTAEFYGPITARDALVHSLNVATVKFAEMVGYSRVVQVARQMGLDPGIRATPAMALGAYEMTPLDVAAGYTIFANDGVRAEPFYLLRVVDSAGKTIEEGAPRTKAVLDPRVAYMVTNVMQDVVNRGTGGTVRKLGFTAPAAGKTGTSRDGWFAGFTSNLVCVVWVGFDDNRDLGLSGSQAAAPIWAEFMKRAVALPRYRSVQGFAAPAGITAVLVDPASGQLATPECPQPRSEIFISGTEPTQMCELHGGHGGILSGPASFFSRLFGKSAKPAAPGAESPSGAPSGNATVAPASGNAQPAPGTAPLQAKSKKKSLAKRIFGIFGDSKKASETTAKPQP